MIAFIKAIIFSFLIVLATTSYGSEAKAAENISRFNGSNINHAPPNSLGFGIGLAFGGIGISYDRAINQRIDLTVAIGNHPNAPDVTYGAGAKFFIHKGNTWQTRVTALYGTNSIVNTSCELFCLIRHHEQFDGFSFGLGQRLVFGSSRKHSVDLDLFYAVASSDAEDLVEETDALFEYQSHVHLSLGYRFYF